MTDNLKNRWVIVGLIWLGALALTCWNSNKIEKIILAREKAEIQVKDRIFWKRNSENIKKILKRGESASHHVESVKLGLLSVENQLISLAGKNGLSNVEMDSREDQGNELGIPAHISFQGSFDGAMEWLNACEQDYPFLLIRNLKILIDQVKMKNAFKVSFYYRFKTTGDEF